LEGLIRPSELGEIDPGPLPCGRRVAPQPRSSLAAASAAAGLLPDGGPRFDLMLPPSGYAWWYVDALSDDRRHGLTMIFFLGSVFSPYYAKARRLPGPGADPLDHCAVNVALYGATKRWAMTERGRSAVQRSADTLIIGPSALRWTGTMIEARLDEITAPLPGRIRGTVRVQPRALTGHSVMLDAAHEHRWSPIAPSARVEVDLTHPRLHWSGDGYFDTNAGLVPLENSFKSWTWARAPLSDGTAVLYDITRRDGSNLALALQIGPDGRVIERASPPAAALPIGTWKIARDTRADEGRSARLIETLEDTPFYTRSVIDTHLFGEQVTGVHESLCLDRFQTGWVQRLVPFRNPRRFW
jgi:carotenoid 1,2-hydratase